MRALRTPLREERKFATSSKFRRLVSLSENWARGSEKSYVFSHCFNLRRNRSTRSCGGASVMFGSSSSDDAVSDIAWGRGNWPRLG